MTPDSRYRITERVAAGGMAEVFRGVAESMQGFRKNIAIKRILPNLTKNKKFVAMFLDEARLSLSLQHANIVQVFDIGHSEDTYFIVMEYVDGVDLKALTEWRRRIGRRIPIAHTLYIVMEILQGALVRARDAQPGDRAPAGHRPPRHLAAQRAHLQAGRGQGRGLRSGQGDQPDRDHRPRRGEGQDELPVARGGARRGGRQPRRHLRRRDSALRDAHREAPLLRRDRLPDRRAGAQRQDPAAAAAEPAGRARAGGRRAQGAGPTRGGPLRAARPICRTRSRTTAIRAGSR